MATANAAYAEAEAAYADARFEAVADGKAAANTARSASEVALRAELDELDAAFAAAHTAAEATEKAATAAQAELDAIAAAGLVSSDAYQEVSNVLRAHRAEYRAAIQRTADLRTQRVVFARYVDGALASPLVTFRSEMDAARESAYRAALARAKAVIADAKAQRDAAIAKAQTRRAEANASIAEANSAFSDIRVRIPVEIDHPFQSKPITDSIASRSPIPVDADH